MVCILIEVACGKKESDSGGFYRLAGRESSQINLWPDI